MPLPVIMLAGGRGSSLRQSMPCRFGACCRTTHAAPWHAHRLAFWVLTSLAPCLQVRFDHQSRTIHFDARGAEVDGPREQLSQLARSLFQAMNMIQPREDAAHSKRTSQARLFVL